MFFFHLNHLLLLKTATFTIHILSHNFIHHKSLTREEVNVLVSLYRGNVVATWLSIHLRHLVPKNALLPFLQHYYVDSHSHTFKYN